MLVLSVKNKEPVPIYFVTGACPVTLFFVYLTGVIHRIFFTPFADLSEPCERAVIGDLQTVRRDREIGNTNAYLDLDSI
jgi:hypothetical protein